uniref:Uncharacterized protein n=1 Tax=Panagrolaimus sp. ES5 TaxID=591445 RepID=A0AC34FDB9_9BILA
MDLKSDNDISEPDVDMISLTNDNMPPTSTDPNEINNFEMLSATVALQPATLKYLNYNEFRDSALRQVFSLPASIMYYVAKNPPSSEVYQKMIQSCKYFFIKNPSIVLRCLHFSDKDGWRTCVKKRCLGPMENQNYRKIDLELDKIQSKIWVLCKLKIDSLNSTIASSAISKLYNRQFIEFKSFNQKIPFNEFLFISQSIEKLNFMKSTVYYQNGNEVPFEIIVSNLPQLKKIYFKRLDSLYDDSKTVAELVKIPHFKNLKCISLTEIFESFDIDLFVKYLKQNTKTTIGLKFNDALSDGYKEKLQAFTDEVLEAEMPRAYLPPSIIFDGQFRQNELHELCLTYV